MPVLYSRRVSISFIFQMHAQDFIFHSRKVSPLPCMANRKYFTDWQTDRMFFHVYGLQHNAWRSRGSHRDWRQRWQQWCSSHPIQAKPAGTIDWNQNDDQNIVIWRLSYWQQWFSSHPICARPSWTVVRTLSHCNFEDHPICKKWPTPNADKIYNHRL